MREEQQQQDVGSGSGQVSFAKLSDVAACILSMATADLTDTWWQQKQRQWQEQQEQLPKEEEEEEEEEKEEYEGVEETEESRLSSGDDEEEEAEEEQGHKGHYDDEGMQDRKLGMRPLQCDAAQLDILFEAWKARLMRWGSIRPFILFRLKKQQDQVCRRDREGKERRCYACSPTL